MNYQTLYRLYLSDGTIQVYRGNDFGAAMAKANTTDGTVVHSQVIEEDHSNTMLHWDKGTGWCYAPHKTTLRRAGDELITMVDMGDHKIDLSKPYTVPASAPTIASVDLEYWLNYSYADVWIFHSDPGNIYLYSKGVLYRFESVEDLATFLCHQPGFKDYFEKYVLEGDPERFASIKLHGKLPMDFNNLRPDGLLYIEKP